MLLPSCLGRHQTPKLFSRLRTRTGPAALDPWVMAADTQKNFKRSDSQGSSISSRMSTPEFPSKPFRNARRQCQAREAAHRRRLPAQRTTVDVEHEFGRNIRDGAARATPLAPQCPVGNLIARLQRRTCCEQVRSKCAPKKAFSRISTTCSTFSVVPTGQLGAQSKAGEYIVFYFSRRVNKWPFIFSLRPTTLKIFRSSDWRL